MGNDNPFLVIEAKKYKMEIFMTIACEQLWLTRNKIRLGGPTLDWRELSNIVNKLPLPTRELQWLSYQLVISRSKILKFLNDIPPS